MLLCTVELSAQISEGGTPPSFRWATLRRSTVPEQVPVTFDANELRRRNVQAERIGQPLVTGSVIDVHYHPANAGEWLTLPDGQRVWQLTLCASNALALMLYYTDFYIPEGGKLYIYNADKSQLLGAYTHRTNPRGGRFATEFVTGDQLTLEYAAAPSGQAPRISIEGVGYGYDNLTVHNGSVQLRASACEVDMNCEEGDAWQNQKKGVCRMVQRIGSTQYLCSASLLNNTAQDLKPYILTAYHCSLGSNNLQATPEDMEQWTFYFHYEREGCDSHTAPAESKTMIGCKKKAASLVNGRSDGLLLLINENIPAHYNVYYNGWDSRGEPAESGVSIHFPQGDYAKISTYFDPVTHYTFESFDGMKGDPNAHWNVIFGPTANGHGITERGSSGSPLFNENKLIVGTLTGGSSTCTKPDGLNLYGKFSCHWNKYRIADSTRMDVWLDPVHTGAQTLTGRFHAGTLPMPRYLTLTYASKKIRLTWMEPLSQPKPLAYNIYNNNLRIGQTTQPVFEDETPGFGEHKYSISAVYDNNNESEFLTHTTFIQEYATPTGVSAIHTTLGKVAVSWQPVVYEQTIYWGGKNAVSQVVMDDDAEGNPLPFYFGQMWMADDIKPFHKKTLTSVKFMPARNNSYEIFIAQGPRVYRQQASNLIHRETNIIPLSTPFVIDGNSSLIVALYVSAPSGYPAYCDAGPAIRGKGNLYSYDGLNWKTLYNPIEPDEDFNLNFFIAAVISSTEGNVPTYTYADSEAVLPSPGAAHPSKTQTSVAGERVALYSMTPLAFPEITGYNVYRNDKKITTVSPSVRRYVDPDDLKQKAFYQVSALYGNNESDLSAKVEIDPQANDAVETVTLKSNVFTNRLEIGGAENVSCLEAYAVSGKRCLQINNPGRIIDMQALPAGIYFIRIYTRDKACITLKAVKK